MLSACSVVRSQLFSSFIDIIVCLSYVLLLLLLSPNLTVSAAVALDGLPQREMQRAASDSGQSRDRGSSDSDANADTMDSQEVGEMYSTALLLVCYTRMLECMCTTAALAVQY